MHQNEPTEPFFGGFRADELSETFNGIPHEEHANGSTPIAKKTRSAKTANSEKKTKASTGVGSRTNFPAHTQFEILMEKTKGLRLLVASTGQPFIVVPQKGHLTPVEIESPEFDDYLSLLSEREKLILKQDARTMTKKVLRAHCTERGAPVELALRMAGFKREGQKEIYIDMADDARRMIRVTKDGWEILEGHAAQSAPVMFRRLHAMLPHSEPVRLDASERADVWQEFYDLLRPGDIENWVKMVAWVINAFRAPTSPYVGLCINGQEGSGKTTRSRMLRMLVDPHRMDLIGEIRKRDDFEPIVDSTFVLAFENLSRIELWLSDALCTIATKGIFPVRTLFTTMGLTIMTARRPMLVNGITDFIQRPDLKRRFLFCEVPPFEKGEKKVGDEKLEARFEAMRGRLLGVILDAVAAGLRHEVDADIQDLDWGSGIPDFGMAVAGAEKAGMLPWGEQKLFHGIYRENSRDAATSATLESPIAQAIIALLEECERKTGFARYEGETSLLYPKLTQTAAWLMVGAEDILETQYVAEGGFSQSLWPKEERARHLNDKTPILELRDTLPEGARHKLEERGRRALKDTYWPKDTRACGQAIRREAAGLRALGIEAGKLGAGHSTLWRLERVIDEFDDAA